MRSGRHECTWRKGTSTAREASIAECSTSFRPAATTWSAGGAGICTPARLRPSSAGRMERCRRPGIRVAADAESSSVPEAPVIRPAHPRDAAALVALAAEGAAEPGGWLGSDGGRRTAADERRYLRALRRYHDAAVFVAETDEGIVGRLSVGPDPHPARRPGVERAPM